MGVRLFRPWPYLHQRGCGQIRINLPATREAEVASYHLYYLHDGQVIGSDSIDAADNQEAVRIARDRGQGEAVEIWNAAGRIRIVAPARTRGAASAEAGR